MKELIKLSTIGAIVMAAAVMIALAIHNYDLL
jgi:hypothetical protein